jgi:predicted permease
MLRKSPGFFLAATAALTIGVGANTAVFSVVNAVLLKPLSFADPDRLVMLLNVSREGSTPVNLSTKFSAWQDHATSLQDLAVYRAAAASMTAGRESEHVATVQVGGEFFRVLAAPMALGRAFTAADARNATNQPAVLTYGFWQRRFGGNRDLIGRAISLDGRSYVVVGVLGSSVDLDDMPYLPSGRSRDVIVPLELSVAEPIRYLVGVARLNTGTTIAVANEDGARVADVFRREYPNEMGAAETFRVQVLRDVIVGSVRPSLLILFAAVGLVLLVACANVANLLLARASVRTRELAVRAALGASRARLVHQLLVESVLLAACGTVLGSIAGVVAIRVLLMIGARDLPRIGTDAAGVAVDWRVLTFAGAMCLLTAVVCGLTPALRACGAHLNHMLGQDQARAGGGPRDSRFRAALVVAEIALALVLVVGAGLLIRSFAALRAVNPGFEPQSVLVVPMAVSGSPLLTPAGLTQLIRNGVERLKATPGVTAAATACCVPMVGSYQLSAIVVGRPLTGRAHGLFAWTDVSPGYFETLKIPVIRGRTLRDDDDASAPGVVVINQAMARQLWPDGDPLSDRVILGTGFGPGVETTARQIVGIVGDVRNGSLERAPAPMMYVPTAQVSDRLIALHARAPLLWIVRGGVDPYSLAPAIQDALRGAGGVPVARTTMRAMDEWIADSTARADFRTLLMTVFAAAALLLAALGAYGVMAYAVQQRLREIGIRIALGAAPGRVRAMVLIEGMRTALLGIAIGTVFAFALTRTLAGFLFGVTSHDPLTFAAVPLLLSAVALVAIWQPARRATRVDPIAVLRHE